MTPRLRTVALLTAAILSTSAGAAYGADRTGQGGDTATGIRSITPITQVHPYGQQVSAVAVEYGATVDPRTLDPGTFSVADTVYNFRFNPIEDLPKLADRSIAHVYTNSRPATRGDHRAVTGRYVIVELDPADGKGSTVIVSKCPTFLCTVKVNPDLPTRVVQREDVRGVPGRGRGKGPVLAKGAPHRSHPMTEEPVDLLVDDFTYGSYLSGGMVLPYHYHLPKNYQPGRRYPLMVVLPGHGMGWDGDNTGVQLAADIPATAWLQREWTGADEDVIVLAPQHQRVGAAAEADLLVKLVERFVADHPVDADRVYATTVSYGSQLAWQAFAKRPDLFAAGLITGGFQVGVDQAEAIAAAEIPVWITHGVNDHLLNVSLARNSRAALQAAYAADGKTPQQIDALLRYTEYGNDAFTQPDYHAAFGPTYADQGILRWLLAQRR
ncbi:PHB depolymerase family esterase [Micromonospora sp. WMMD956]|uniref:PHB depolymerase family esterase n=1 Tax=Micromonospora sp. WMMD956 TaxID=3016108 RepID=UPI0024172564|nr:PHB depolymerase family esterase [Micromonospora sp. WMMD956]MDG4819273.1 PHB depolymerase family esterase [Micromonospora sp. WMMD956]